MYSGLWVKHNKRASKLKLFALVIEFFIFEMEDSLREFIINQKLVFIFGLVLFIF